MKKNTMIVERGERKEVGGQGLCKSILNLRMNFAFESREILRTEQCYWKGLWERWFFFFCSFFFLVALLYLPLILLVVKNLSISL